MTEEELTARIQVLLRERHQVMKDYEAKHNRLSDEIQQYQIQLNELVARKDHNMPF